MRCYKKGKSPKSTSRLPLLLQRGGFARLTGDNRELLIIPGAELADIYDP